MTANLQKFKSVVARVHARFVSSSGRRVHAGLMAVLIGLGAIAVIYVTTGEASLAQSGGFYECTDRCTELWRSCRADCDADSSAFGGVGQCYQSCEKYNGSYANSQCYRNCQNGKWPDE